MIHRKNLERSLLKAGYDKDYVRRLKISDLQKIHNTAILKITRKKHA